MPWFEGHTLAFVGIGGGSDCIQAAVLALLEGKSACVLSIRHHTTSSQDPATGTRGAARRITHHGGEITRGVYRITAQTTGSGRFLEFIPADELPVYLVVDYRDGNIPQQIQAALCHFGAVESLIAVDTGGDSLYHTESADQAQATPEQDLASLQALSTLKRVSLYSCILALGVDAPPYANAVLRAAGARMITFSSAEKRTILDLYQRFEMDGSNPARYGKTPLAWQAALRGERGLVRLPLPEHLITDPRNPWNPYVTITDEMQFGYVMDLQAHLSAVSVPLPASADASHGKIAACNNHH